MKQLAWVRPLTDNFTVLWSPEHCMPKVHINSHRNRNVKKLNKSLRERAADMMEDTQKGKAITCSAEIL